MNQNPREAQPESPRRLVELMTLLNSLTGETSDLGTFAEIESKSMPAPYRKLLDHNDHMTIAIEGFYGCPVSVQVLQSRVEGSIYIREILLRRTTDQQVVQYGIVRLQLNTLDEIPRQEILSEKIPLGRVLIEHNVMRQVELVDLWKIEVGPRLAERLGVEVGSITYGRTALIYFSDQPALELLEVLA